VAAPGMGHHRRCKLLRRRVTAQMHGLMFLRSGEANGQIPVSTGFE
jgi:hypothetical protein